MAYILAPTGVFSLGETTLRLVSEAGANGPGQATLVIPEAIAMFSIRRPVIRNGPTQPQMWPRREGER